MLRLLMYSAVMDHVYRQLSLEVLLTAVADYYMASSAEAVREGLCGVDDDTCALSISLWAMDAEVEVSAN